MDVSNSTTSDGGSHRLSGMEQCFLATGVLCMMSVILGLVYFVLYSLHISPASMRARKKRALWGLGSNPLSTSSRTQTHVSLFSGKSRANSVNGNF